MVAFLPIVMAGVAVAGLVGKAIARRKANKKLKELQQQDPVRQRNTDVDTQYAMTQQLLNANDPYEQEAQRAAVTRFGNLTAANAKAATNSSQLLAANAAAEGQLAQDQATINAGNQDSYYNNLQLMQQATQARQIENDAMYQDEVRRHSNKGQVQGAIAQNNASTWGDVTNVGMGLASTFATNGIGIGKKKTG